MNDTSLPDTPCARLGEPVLPVGGGRKLARWAPIPLRLIVGYGFIAHGYAKIMRGPDVFIGVVHALGVPAPHLMGWATIVFELVCGLAVLVGAFIPLASVPMVAILLVAMLTVHVPYGFTSIKLVTVTGSGPQFGPPGYECDLLYLACLATLLMTGPGPWSIDHLRDWWQRLRHKHDVTARAARPEESVRDARTAKLSALIVAASLPGTVLAPAGETGAQLAFRHTKVRHVDSRRFTEQDPIARCAPHMQDGNGRLGIQLVTAHQERSSGFFTQHPVAHDVGVGPVWETWRTSRGHERADDAVPVGSAETWTVARSGSGCLARRPLLASERSVPVRSMRVGPDLSLPNVPSSATDADLGEQAGTAGSLDGNGRQREATEGAGSSRPAPLGWPLIAEVSGQDPSTGTDAWALDPAVRLKRTGSLRSLA